ncbi:MAG: hypothetical protein JSV82_01560 [Planctomycetota bacterium]|nr:MAG: hypothetical protein JSV82_01560 [Planctomycetota bacterium]
MCRRLLLLIFSILALALNGSVQGTDYYVSPSGSDSNPGTSPEQAWATIDKVNQGVFVAGDSVLFEGGETFYGSMQFDASDGGTATNPLTISSYGTARATIDSADANGLCGHNCAGFEITNLNFVGSGGADPNGNHGIYFINDLNNNIKLEYIYINNVEISNYFERGIYILGNSASNSGFKDVRITNTKIHDGGNIGINSGGWWPVTGWAHEDIYISDCEVYNILGIPGREPHSGNGIVLSGVDGAVIEYCEAYNNGELCDAPGGGPLGIWGWEANDLVIQFCESHHNKTSGGDGGGFDLDGGCINSVMQYNYSHDNEGCSYLICHFGSATQFKNNVCRYNIGENDCTGSRSPMGAIHFWSAKNPPGLQNTHVYNNTLYLGPNSIGKGIFVMSEDIDGLYIRNNIIVTTGGLTMVEVMGRATDKVTFQGNCYWSSGDDFIIKWGRCRTYYSLDEWRLATGQEMLDGAPIGFQVDPKLIYAGSGGTIGDPCQLDTLEAYKLGGASPIIDQGLDLTALFGTDVGTRDFYGSAIPDGSGYEIGAHEYDADTPPDYIAPQPDPMTWMVLPHATGAYSISMTATTGLDVSGIEYYFECALGGGDDSGWQDSPTYEDTGLTPSTQYSYRVQARDKSANQNAVGWSTTESGTTDPPDLTPPSPDPMTWAIVPYETGSDSITMTATAATDVSGVEYYFECVSGGGHDSGWQDSTVYEDVGLEPSTQYSYRVQAQDKSPNQNATGWSTTESATTMSSTTLFADGFESGDFVASGWTTDGTAEVLRSAAYTGEYGAELQIAAWIEKAINTVGYSHIHLKFVCRTKGLDSGEYLYVEWWDGSSWNEFGVIEARDWTFKDMKCPAGAGNNSSFKIRFRVVSSNPNEEWVRIDDVEVAGTSQ